MSKHKPAAVTIHEDYGYSITKSLGIKTDMFERQFLNKPYELGPDIEYVEKQRDIIRFKSIPEVPRHVAMVESNVEAAMVRGQKALDKMLLTEVEEKMWQSLQHRKENEE